jgi:hypothetical protein
MSPKRKSDVLAEQREHEERTDQEVAESNEIKKDGEDASSDWSKQSEPGLLDTKDECNSIAEHLRSDIREQHGDQAQKVEGSIENQRREISEPARAGEAEERAAADELDVAASKNKRFGKILSETSERRQDAAIFFDEVAGLDEEDQNREKETLDDHRRAVEAAIQGIRDL